MNKIQYLAFSKNNDESSYGVRLYPSFEKLLVAMDEKVIIKIFQLDNLNEQEIFQNLSEKDHNYSNCRNLIDFLTAILGEPKSIESIYFNEYNFLKDENEKLKAEIEMLRLKTGEKTIHL